MTKIYREKDVNRNVLKNRVLAVLGFGSQGHAHALNLRDSGYNVVVGLPPKSRSTELARRQGLKVLNTADAVKTADVVLVAVPDMKQPEVFQADIEPNLKPDSTLLFLHGLCVHFGLLKISDDVNVALVAPKAPGNAVRSQYLEGNGVPALIAVHRGGRETKAVALAWADGIGSTRAGVIETTFKEESETDLFGEQAVLCGGVSALVRSAFETLVAAGCKPEMAYFECCHELKMVVDLIAQSGISGMYSAVSETAKYGALTRGDRIISPSVKREMGRVLKEIQSGRFAKEWSAEYSGGLKKYAKLLSDAQRHPLERLGQRLRSLMPWLAKQNSKGAQLSYTALRGSDSAKSAKR